MGARGGDGGGRGTKGPIGEQEMAIRSAGMDPDGGEVEDAHLLILQAPQAENCSRDVFGFGSCFWARREAEEEEPSEGEPELCLIGIIGKKEERREKREERERKMREGGGTFVEVKRTPLCIQPRP